MGMSLRKLSVLVGKNIENKREELGMNIYEFSGKIGLEPYPLLDIERGRVLPTFEQLPRIATELECSVADLFRNNKK